MDIVTTKSLYGSIVTTKARYMSPEKKQVA